MRIRTKVSALGVGLVMALGTVVFADPPAASAAVCPDNDWRVADGRTTELPAGLIRTGPSINCPAVGVVGPGPVRLDCFTIESTGIWSHVTSLRTGVRGWVPGDYANAPC